MASLTYYPGDELEKWDLGDSGARAAVWNGRKALYMEKMNSAVFLRDEIPFRSFRLRAEVAIPEPIGFVGFAFGAKDTANYELIYLAPEEIQYDPVMNGSMTWQVYNGPSYQKPLPKTTGGWRTFAVEVHPGGAAAYLGDDPEPQLVISNLQHGGAVGKIGLWSFLPCYVSKLTVEELAPVTIQSKAANARQPAEEDFVTEWHVSQPYVQDERPEEAHRTKAVVEENGVLNLNRRYKAEQGLCVEACAEISVAEDTESLLTVGFSDRLRLWVNEEEVFQGSWKWNPPASDGRIRPDYAHIPVRWKAGSNTIRAEVANTEFFGWGLAVRTGLPGSLKEDLGL